MSIHIGYRDFKQTHGGLVWTESGYSTATLTASKSEGGPIDVTWNADPKKVLTGAAPERAQSSWTITPSGFGKVKITASSEQYIESVDIYVGSVIIAGSDNKYWQVFPDGSSKPLDDHHLYEDVRTLVKNHTIVADMTEHSHSEAVTCYLLSLQSFRPKIKQS